MRCEIPCVWLGLLLIIFYPLQRISDILRASRRIRGGPIFFILHLIKTERNSLFSLQSRGVGLYITHLRPGVRKTFEKAGVLKLLGPEAIQDNVADAMARVNMRSR